MFGPDDAFLNKLAEIGRRSPVFVPIGGGYTRMRPVHVADAAEAVRTKKYRSIGTSGLEVSTLCLGGNVFGWTADQQTSFRILDAFVEAGGNFVDTADVYSRWAPGVGGESETVLGEWLKRLGNRKKVILVTKVGMEMGPGLKGLSQSYIVEVAEKSLKRLQTDYIDLYQSHVDDADTPLETTLGAFEKLLKEGKVRAIGASNYSGERLREALETSRRRSTPRYECLQPLCNLYDREKFEKELEPVCKESTSADCAS